MSGHCFHNQFSAVSPSQTALPSPVVQNRVISDFCVAFIVSFPLLSNSCDSTWRFCWLYRVGCDVVEKGTGLPKFSQLQGGAAQVC